MFWNIELIFGMIVYNRKLQLNFEIRSAWMIFGQFTVVGLWNMGKILSCHHFILLYLEILTWILVWECLIISYRWMSKFVLVEWFLANLQSLGFEIWPNIELSPLYFTMIWDIDLVFGMRVYSHMLQINFEIRSGWMIFGQLTGFGLWNLAKYLVVTTFFTMIWDIDLIFGMRVYNHKLQINFEIHSGWMIMEQLTAVRLWNLAKYLVVTTFFSLWFEILPFFDFWYVNV